MGISVFDLDGTVTRSDTYRAYLQGFLLNHPARWPTIPLLAGAVALHKARVRSNHWLKRVFLTLVLGGAEKSTIDRWTARFCEKAMTTLVRRQALERIAERRKAGDRIMIATASPDLYVQALARHLDADHVICTQAEWSATGRLTGRLLGGNCYGPEKRVRLEAWLGTRSTPGAVTAFSDHHADLPLLALADHAVAVSPTPLLKIEAERLGIPVEHWS